MLQKCKRYPECDCFQKWVKPAAELVSAEEAEMFAACMKEIDSFCEQTEWLYYEGMITKLSSYNEIIPESLSTLFADCVAVLLDFDYQWKMPVKTDVFRIMTGLKKQGYRETALSDLTNNNTDYHKLTEKYHEKIRTATQFLEAKDFLEAERKRVETIFIQPLRILHSAALMKMIFNHSVYCEFAFTHLMKGEDWTLRQVKRHAFDAYRAQNGTVPPDKEEFEKAIIGNAARGVGYLMYYRFLNENLLNVDSAKTVSSLVELADFLEDTNKLQYDKFVSGLQTLERYVVKNVYEDNKSGIERLRQLERNCTRWLYQLDAVFIETVGESVDFADPIVNDQKNKKLAHLKNTLSKAIDFIRLQMEGKRVAPSTRALKKKRKGISLKKRALLQKEIHSTCPFCTNEDVDHFEIHHIDENTLNDELSNLLMLCPLCHSKITKKDIGYQQVMDKKLSLVKQPAPIEHFEKVELESEFPGGDKAWQQFIIDTMTYPQQAQDERIQGAVEVQFVVNKYGQVSEVEAISGPQELREEAEAVITKSPRWIPAHQNGSNVKSYKKQSIVFRLDS